MRLLPPSQERRAKALYERFFREHPGETNPSDINSIGKWNFALAIGWRNVQLMQRARKRHTSQLGWPYPWTRRTDTHGKKARR